jgi:hypothetical protein
MRQLKYSRYAAFASALASLWLAACGGPVAPVNSNSANTNAATSPSPTASSTATTSSVDSREPDQYQATVTIKLEAIGAQNPVTLPTLAANVSRSGDDRRMEFTIPAGGRVIYLDKGTTNYLVLPDKNQYAELNKESTGFEIRRLLMPEDIVRQVKATPGLQLVGDETLNGREATKYRYAAVANTQTQAGDVATESYLYVDKATGLPLRSETVSQTSGNVQGYKGLRLVTEMTDIRTDPAADQFQPPTNLQKVDADQVRAQVDLIFKALAAVIGQMMQQGQAPVPVASPMTSPTANPVR